MEFKDHCAILGRRAQRQRPRDQESLSPPGWDSGFEFSGGPGGFGAEHSALFEALFGAARRGGAQAGASGRGQDHHAKIVVPLENRFHGATREITLHSPEMDAQGHVALRERTLQVGIPKGLRAGQQLCLAGQGSPGLGNATRGDLSLEIEFAPHPRWRVDGRDLYVTLRVAPWEAALGADVVPSPAGDDKARAAYRRFAEDLAFDPRAEKAANA